MLYKNRETFMEEVNKRYLSFFQHQYKRIIIRYNSTKACVIIEPRQHEFLEFVIKNVMYFLPNWSLYIFHSKENKEYVKDIIGPQNLDQVHFIQITEGNIGIHEYNTLITSLHFWNIIDSEDILIFQTDSYIRKSGIECFLPYGFSCVGAPWIWWPSNELQGGNGGFSLRKKSIMLKIIEQYPYNNRNHGNEDIYFSNHSISVGGKLPPVDISNVFSVETIYSIDPYATHNGWRHYNGFLDINFDSKLVYIPKNKYVLFGDPAYMNEKFFIVEYCNGNKLTYFEDEDLLLNIGFSDKFFYGSQENLVDVTSIVWSLFYIHIPINKNEIFGDPHYLRQKLVYMLDQKGNLVQKWMEDEPIFLSIEKFYIFKYGSEDIQIDITEKVYELNRIIFDDNKNFKNEKFFYKMEYLDWQTLQLKKFLQWLDLQPFGSIINLYGGCWGASSLANMNKDSNVSYYDSFKELLKIQEDLQEGKKVVLLSIERLLKVEKDLPILPYTVEKRENCL